MLNPSVIKLAVAAILPAVLSLLVYMLLKKTAFGRVKPLVQQLIIGLAFGGLAILGTEWGIPMNGAQANCRDAAVLCAGLLFGAPCGIIAGIIGGVERWIAVAWGVGTYTRVACTISTILAGFYAAALRKFMFEDKKPSWSLALAIGVVMEVFHLTMVFLTNMADAANAAETVRACAVAMISANGLSVMLATMIVAIAAKEKLSIAYENVNISQTIQRWLLLCVVVAFLLSTGFTYRLQTAAAENRAKDLLSGALSDVKADIKDASDRDMIKLTHDVANQIGEHGLMLIASMYNISEISVVNSHGIIADSTQYSFVGYDMRSGAQSAEFLCLLGDAQEYAQEYGPISYDGSIWRKYVGVKTKDGFVQIGYDDTCIQQHVSSKLKASAVNRRVGETGYVVIADSRQKVVSAPLSFKGRTLEDSGVLINEEMPQNKMIQMTVNGQNSFCMYENAEGYYFVSVMPESEVMRVRNLAMLANTFMEVLVFALMFGMIYQLIKFVVVKRMKRINGSLARITGGDLNEVVDVRSSTEFASLSDDINSTVSTLKRYIAEAAARIDEELEFAKNIQFSSLPSVFPKRDNLDLYARIDTAKEVGGDFYDFYFTNKDELNFLVADVSGKGIPAALFMMRAKTELKSLAEAGMSVDEIFAHGNDALCEGNDADMFVTAWQGRLDLLSGRVNFVNGGHNPPLIRHGSGSFEYLQTKPNLVLGAIDGIPYQSYEEQLKDGDIIFLYTDGVTEATDANEELYGEERLCAILNSREFSSMKELCESVKADVDAFVGEAPQFDDITMMALRYRDAEQA